MLLTYMNARRISEVNLRHLWIIIVCYSEDYLWLSADSRQKRSAASVNLPAYYYGHLDRAPKKRVDSKKTSGWLHLIVVFSPAFARWLSDDRCLKLLIRYAGHMFWRSCDIDEVWFSQILHGRKLGKGSSINATWPCPNKFERKRKVKLWGQEYIMGWQVKCHKMVVHR